MNDTQPDIDAFSRASIFIAAAVVLCNYYYLYFVPFFQGEAEASSFYSLLKAVGIFAASAALLTSKVRRLYTLKETLLVIFLCLSAVGFFSKRALLGYGDLMFLNTVACFAPFLLLMPKPNPRVVIVFFESCLFIITLQIICDTAIYLVGASIWENKAFIGGVGNPSSFGILCNIFAAYSLVERPPKLSSYCYLPTLSFGIYMTNSLLSIGILCMLIIVWGLRRITIKKAATLLIAGTATIIISSYALSDHLSYKLKSAASLIASEQDSTYNSRSISLRRHIHERYSENFTYFPLQGIATGFFEKSYMKFDSQLLTYFSSFGLLTSLLFFTSISMALFHSHRKKMIFPSMCILIFCITFLTNRIMDYYPMPIFLALAFMIIRIRANAVNTLDPR